MATYFQIIGGVGKGGVRRAHCVQYRLAEHQKQHGHHQPNANGTVNAKAADGLDPLCLSLAQRAADKGAAAYTEQVATGVNSKNSGMVTDTAATILALPV